MEEGISYYKDLFANVMKNSNSMKEKIAKEIEEMEAKLMELKAELALVMA
jgi:UDP-N-acetylglucosamine 2-epimerase